MRKTPFFFGIALGLSTVAGSAAAQYAPLPPPPPPAAPTGYYPPPMPQRQHFGDASQLVISNDTNFGLSGSSFSNNGGSTFTLTLQPAIDWFIIQNLSIGGLVTFDHTSSNMQGASNSSNVYAVGGRVGYNIAIGDAISWWPKLALLYAGSSGSTTPAGAGAQTSTSGNAFDLQVFAPLLLHPINHFFLGIGPFVQTDLTASSSTNGMSNTNPSKTTSYGALFDMGGWMDF
jgi:hypothetical protein